MMTQKVQELINKIKQEGVEAAETKSQEIEQEAQKKAKKIIDDANRQAEQIVLKAQEDAKTKEEATKKALQQAARDMLLSLRKKMSAMLDAIMKKDVDKALSSDLLVSVIEQMAKGYLSDGKTSEGVNVIVSEKDLKALNDGAVKKLKDALKTPVVFESADDISSGFQITFDAGKSFFDFTDKSLVEYLSAFVNDEVSELLKSSAEG